ncbi:MAG: hypothetical protein H0X39_03990 [Actinobacteria bacterium]|nr:hypothetical protein [Actinomycetota bacterium]
MRARTIRGLVSAGLCFAALCLAGLCFAGAAQAGDRQPNAGRSYATATSSNWAGYAVGGRGLLFSDVKGSWIEPYLACASSGVSYASFWVGLGGVSANANGLEQIGTEADCLNGAAVHSVWYELIPAASVDVPIAVQPGNAMTAEVSVAGQVVTLAITNTTTGAAYSTTATLTSNLDLSSAEWIAEAPSLCVGLSSRCTPLPLAGFGTASFMAASATANGHVGPIVDPGWLSTAITLHPAVGGVSAAPSAVGLDGGSFSVSTGATATPVAATPRVRGSAGPTRPRKHR